MKRSFFFMLWGAGLGLGAPLGALLGHRLWKEGLFPAPEGWIGELADNGFFYAYMFLGTCLAFALFGYVLGSKVDGVIFKNRELSHEVLTDPLTGLGNHRFLHDFLKVEFRAHHQKDRPLTCVMMDLDFFKRVNDTYGHPFGDRVLVGFSTIVKRSLRAGDVATRYGGEEFLCILPNCGEEDARKVAERIRTETEKAVFTDGPHQTRITVSLGAVTVYNPLETAYQAILDAADKNLYEAKRQGRNQLVLGTLRLPDPPGTPG